MLPNLSPFVSSPVHHYNLKYTVIWEGVKKNAVGNKKKNMEESFTIALFFSVSSHIPIAMAEKISGRGRGAEKAFKLGI